jgi:hypothetical protein
MTIVLPRRRQQALGKNIAKAPTRGDVTRVSPASDPGARGGPTDTNIMMFGGGSGVQEFGEGIANIGMQQLEDIHTDIAKTEAVQIKTFGDKFKLDVAELGKNVGPNDPDALQAYYKKADDYTIAELKKVTESGGSDHYKSALTQRYNTERDIAKGAITGAVRGYQDDIIVAQMNDEFNASFNLNKNDVRMGLKENQRIFEEKRGIVSYEARLTAKKEADKTLVFHRSNIHLGNAEFQQAREALWKDTQDGSILTKEYAAQVEKIQATETAAHIAREVKAQEKTTALKPGDLYTYIDDVGMFMYPNDEFPKGKIIPGTVDLKNKILETTDMGSFHIQEGEDGKIKLTPLEGTAKPPPETAEKAMAGKLKATNDYLAKFYLDGKVPLEDAKKIAGLSETKLSEFKEKIAAIEEMNIDDDIKQSMIQEVILGSPKDIQIQRSYLEEALEKNTITKDQYDRAMLSIMTGGKDIDTAEVKGIKAGIAEVAKEKVIAKSKEGLPTEVTSSDTSQMVGMLHKMMGHTKGKGDIYAIQTGYEQIFSEVVGKAEEFRATMHLPSGTAVMEAWLWFKRNRPDELPQRESAIAQFNEILGLVPAKDDSEAQLASITLNTKENKLNIPGTDAALRELDSDALKSKIEQAYADAKISIIDATGMYSGVRAMLGATVAQIPGFGWLESKRVTKARLMYSLIARDFVRYISLSPRFAVKEQELIQSMFPGAELLNAPGQAINRLLGFEDVIHQKLKAARLELKRNVGSEKEANILEDAARYKETLDRIKQFKGEFNDIKTTKEVNKATPEKANEFYSALSPREKQSLSIPMKEALLKKMGKYKNKKVKQ